MRILLGMVALVLTLFALDINTASVEELTQLKGIGEKKAQAIVAYRTEQKCFKSLDELQNVKGIGEAFFKKNEKELSLSPCK
ncbi:MAG: competence protein ComEA [Deltaproteobacteria bacterium HGW-Deltaproteobacteria-24]|jgi:competence protein ComEA|nr:MAG: competence protein ComEA [Deltaproteobacteria bacterium HGW-Deltaproteobacteria-24]